MKKFLIILGVILFVVAGVYGTFILSHRHKVTEDVKQPSPSSKSSQPPEASKVPSFNKTTHSTTDPVSIWVIANKKHPLNPENYAPTDLKSVGGNQLMRVEAATALLSLIAAGKAQGLTINPLSGYRSYATQVSVYGNEVKNYGQAAADSESARPGYSEHQTGLAIDVGGGGCGIEDCFGNTAEGKWLAANAYSYGFIIRYPADKVAITGYRAEPWHIRFVGTVLSQEMHTQGITTLEEFFGVSGGDYAN